jgi:drug/metabolite transporter (DMT)-like permease
MDMLATRKLRRAIGAVLVILGALFMWLAPGPTFTSVSGAGLGLLVAGIVLELVGITLERREENRKKQRIADL